MKLTTIAAALGAVLLTAAGAQAQGVVRGAQEGAIVGNRAAGPVGAAVGGTVGGVTGGVVGGVKGVLGIPQDTRPITTRSSRAGMRTRTVRSRSVTTTGSTRLRHPAMSREADMRGRGNSANAALARRERDERESER